MAISRDFDELNNAMSNIKQRAGGVLTFDPDALKDFTYTGWKLGDMNCWGFVALSAGWITTPEWLPADAMEHFLAQNTKEVELGDIQPGDVVVYRYTENHEYVHYGYCEQGELCHTALVADERNGQVLHKPGSCALELAHEKDRYDNTIVTFRRIVARPQQQSFVV